MINVEMPKTMEELSASLSRCTPKSAIVAGGTDWTLRQRRQNLQPDLLLFPGGIEALHQIQVTDDTLLIGSMATMQQIADTLLPYPEFRAICDAASHVGSPQIRNKATMAGNLCSASPAGDMLPIALLYDAELQILSADGTAAFISAKDFITGPGKNILLPGQIVTGIRIDRKNLGSCVSAFCKIGYRRHVSIARESMAILLFRHQNGITSDARITLGAVSDTPIRVPEAELLMRGRFPDTDMLKEITPVISRTIHSHCRPKNRLYKTEAAKGLVADTFLLLYQRL